jgi:hypothetical protein
MGQQDNDEDLKKEIASALHSGKGPAIARFALAVVSGAIPLVGGVFGGICGAWSEQEQDHFNKLLTTWLRLQEDEIREIGTTLLEIMARVDSANEEVKKRLESPEYLRLLKKSFRNWSAAESEEKRTLIRNLLSNAAMTKICSDDVLGLFVQWIDIYSEAHFNVVKAVYNNDGITRRLIWERIHGVEVREDSADADLFKLVIHDLSIGHIIRQHRETDRYGNFIKSGHPRQSSSGYYKSAFDDDSQYELTELGKQFVHYTLNEIVPKIGSGATKEI